MQYNIVLRLSLPITGYYASRCSDLTAKLGRTSQVDDHSLQADTGSLKFTQPADPEGDEFHPSALKQSFTAENSGSVKSLVMVKLRRLYRCVFLTELISQLSADCLYFFIAASPIKSFFVSSSQKNFADHTEVTTDQTMNNGNKLPSTDYRLERGFVSRNM